jgi:hypothetical protein
LELAAPAYMSDVEWSTLSGNWLDEAIAYCGTPCKGVPGPITAQRRPSVSHGHKLYTLADYLEQLTKVERLDVMPPIGFWEAAHVGQRAVAIIELAASALERGLYEQSTGLLKVAVGRGHSGAGGLVIRNLRELGLSLDEAVPWILDRAECTAALDDRILIEQLMQTGFDEAAAGFAAKSVVGTRLDQYGTGDLIRLMRELDGGEILAKALLDRIDEFSMDDALSAFLFLQHEGKLLSRKKLRALAERTASIVRVGDADAALFAYYGVSGSGSYEALSVLADRISKEMALDDAELPELLEKLYVDGFDSAVMHILDRILNPVAGAPAGQYSARLWATPDDCREDFLEVARMAVREADFSDPAGVAELIEVIRERGSRRQMEILLERDLVTVVQKGDFFGVVALIRALFFPRAAGQMERLIERAVCGSLLRDASNLALLIDTLSVLGCQRKLGTEQLQSLLNCLSYGEADELARLIEALRRAYPELARDFILNGFASRVRVESAAGIARLLLDLKSAGAHQEIEALLSRPLSEDVSIDDVESSAYLLHAFNDLEAHEHSQILAGRLARRSDFDHEIYEVRLLSLLRKTSCHRWADFLETRLIAAGMYQKIVQEFPDRFKDFTYGRCVDGSPAEPWNWQSL